MNSFTKWVGGQRILARTISAMIPSHSCYVEPFGGAAWVLFTKPPSAVEVYNDLDGRLVALFRCVKEHPQEFVRQLSLHLPSRELFELYCEQPGLTELQRAARFYFVLKMSFGGQARTFGPRKTEPTRFIWAKLIADIERVRERLERTTIEHCDFEEILHRYDRDDTFFFLSPPYWGTKQYEIPFGPEDHGRLKEALRRLKGHWLLLYNDHAWVRNAYARRRTYRVESMYTLQRGRPRTVSQLLITNYNVPRGSLHATKRTVRRVR